MNVQGEIDGSTTIVEDINYTLSDMDRYSRQKIRKDVVELNSIINQLDIMNIYKLLHPKTADYTFFSSPMEHSPR